MARPVDGRRRLGQEGEAAVARWYESQGWEVLARNWRCREGELDLILRRRRVVVFCEVKARTTDAFGSPFDAVGRQKQQRIRHLAARWLQESGLAVREVRFDVAAVLAGEIEVVEGAF